jgi:flagellum-specific peptidoglycan hydrolase FlgJ
MAFVINSAGAPASPKSVERRRRLAEAMLSDSMNTAPIQSWTQGAARLANALVGGLQYKQADEAEQAGRKEASDAIGRLTKAMMGGGDSAPPVAPPMSFSGPQPSPEPSGDRDAFVGMMSPLAQKASEATGVDPRIIMAQAAVETGWGKSAPGGNYFGIKSHGQPGGQTLATTEVEGGAPVATQASFRTYAGPEQSASDYADFINNNPRYAGLKAAQGLENQAAALQASGYATDPQYGQKVLSIAQGLPGSGGTSQGQFNPPNTPQPVRVADAGPSMQDLLAAAQNPWLDDNQSRIINTLIESKLKQGAPIEYGFSSLPDGTVIRTNPRTGQVERAFQGGVKPPEEPSDVREYRFYVDQETKAGRQPEPFGEWQRNNRKAGSTTINTGDTTSEFGKKADAQLAEHYGKLAERGPAAASTVQAIGQMRELLTVAPQGPIQGRLAEMFPGFSSAGDAFNATINQLAPSLRIPGSGAQSDKDMDILMGSMARLRNAPEANQIILNAFERKAQIDQKRSELANAALRRRMPLEEAQKQIEALEREPIIDEKTRGLIRSLGPKSDQGGAPAGSPTAEPVRVSSPEEARKLPKGTPIILPDGTPGVVP